MMFRIPKNAHIWLPGLLASQLGKSRQHPPKRVWLMIGDHYEPLWNGADERTGAERVAVWKRNWPEIAARHSDSAGRSPKYTFFYPQEEYRPQFLDPLAEMTERGIGDVEIHIHHDGEGEQNFVDRMSSFVEILSARHGLLHRLNGRTVFGFIHGNWALDNSRPDGRWCGLNNELTLLLKLGCYADFTEPSAPNGTQVHMINSIYWAQDDPLRPKSHDRGEVVEPGSPDHPDDLLMITGPLGLRYRNHGGAHSWLPRLDTGELACYDPPTRRRIGLWLDVAPRIGDDVFIKLYAHGTQERHSAVLLQGALDTLFSGMTAETQKRGMQLYFASAWEMRLAVEAIRNRQCPVQAAGLENGQRAVRVSD
jgi:hypothetical protein